MDQQLTDIIDHLELNPADAFSRLNSFVRTNALPPEIQRAFISVISDYNDLLLNENLLNDKTGTRSDYLRRFRQQLEGLSRQTETIRNRPPAPDPQDQRGLEHVKQAFKDLRPANEQVVEMKGVDFSYGRFSLTDINLSLKYGEITGIIGENGNGKSTLLKMIAGNLQPRSGTIRYHFAQERPGGKLDYSLLKQQIAYIPQRLPIWDGQVKVNLHFMAAIKGIMGQKNIDDVDYILHRLNLSKYGNCRWNELSGGYQMRFELANMLIWNPKLVILDEPLANLDIIAQSLFLKDLKDLAGNASNPFAVVISSQHLQMLDNVADNIVFLKNGKQTFNAERGSIGGQQDGNAFELEGEISAVEVKTILSELPNLRIQTFGFTTVIFTSRDVTLDRIMGLVSKSNGKSLTGLRDITHSSKLLLYKSYEY